MKMRHFIAIAFAAVMAAACTQKGTVYQVPIAEARRAVVASVLPPSLFGLQTPDWYVSGTAGNSDVAWVGRKNGKELFRYVASLKEESQGSTRVNVELIAASDAENPALKKFYLVAITERIASTLERRPFDMERIKSAKVAAAVGNMGAIRASMEEAAAAADRLESSSAYRRR